MPTETQPIGVTACDEIVMPFDTQLTLAMEAEVWEEGGEAPTNIIGDDQDWYVIVRWTVTGNMARHLCGRWCPRVHIECYGPGDEETYAPEADNGFVDFDPCGDGTYEARIDIPAGGIEAEECGTMCCLAITLSSFDLCGNAGHMFAFCEGPCIMFHHATHETVPHPPEVS